jgi:transcriptional repressor NrdR
MKGGTAMRCPFCGYTESKVIDTRPTDEGEKIRRRRECLRCGKRFTSYEIIETTPLMVIKRDGSREVFSRDKLLNGMIKSCEKRPVSLSVLEEAVSDIVASLQNEMEREVPSTLIGELCMEKLKGIDQVAYVRFASVYRQFKDINSFLEELKNILEHEGEG